MKQEMRIIGFRFNKIFIEKNEGIDSDLKISPNINIQSIEKIESKTKQETLKIDFQFNIDYDLFGKIELSGKLFLAIDPKLAKIVLDGWKNKKLDDNINITILNIIMQKASIKALELEEEIGLPLHIQLPLLKLGNKN